METFYLISASVLWGAAHSWTASLAFKNRMEQAFGAGVNRWYRLTYNAFSFISILPVLLLMTWLPDHPFYALPMPWTAAFHAVQALGVILLALGVLQTDTLSFVGLRQLLQAPGNTPSKLITRGLYRHVRHPLYTAGLMIMWFTPQVSFNQFVVYAIFTLYILVGALFEERKLLREFGQAYADYRASTPMLIPFLRLG